MDQKGLPSQVFDLGPRLPWIWLTAGVSLIGFMESVGVAALMFTVLPNSAAAVATVALLTPTVGLLVVLASAVNGRIVLNADGLTLRFGLLGGTSVPTRLVGPADRYDPATALNLIGLGIDAPLGSGRATATRGGQSSFVRVTLRSPTRVRLTVWRYVVVNELVLSTSQPDELVELLNRQRTVATK